MQGGRGRGERDEEAFTQWHQKLLSWAISVLHLPSCLSTDGNGAKLSSEVLHTFCQTPMSVWLKIWCDV